MPAIRYIKCNDGSLEFQDDRGIVHRFSDLDITPDLFTGKLVEDFLNIVWIPQHTQPGIQMKAHVFSLQPLKTALIAANAGEIIPDNWWSDVVAPDPKNP